MLFVLIGTLKKVGSYSDIEGAVLFARHHVYEAVSKAGHEISIYGAWIPSHLGQPDG